MFNFFLNIKHHDGFCHARVIMVKSANISDSVFALTRPKMKDSEPVYTPIGQVPVQPGRELVLAPNGCW